MKSLFVIVNLCRLLTLFKDNFIKKFFQEYYQSAKLFDPDQGRHFVGPDLCPNCCNGYHGRQKSPLAMRKLNLIHRLLHTLS